MGFGAVVAPAQRAEVGAAGLALAIPRMGVIEIAAHRVPTTTGEAAGGVARPHVGRERRGWPVGTAAEVEEVPVGRIDDHPLPGASFVSTLWIGGDHRAAQAGAKARDAHLIRAGEHGGFHLGGSAVVQIRDATNA